MREIFNYLDSITFSIDSVDSNINENIGRGKNHWENIKILLGYLQDTELKVNINTVASKQNINGMEELGKTLERYKINGWRIFKFMPLRETAEVNRSQFEITDSEFQNLSAFLTKKFKTLNVETRQESDMEDKYILIVANGDIVMTENGKDVKKGNALKQSITDLVEENDNMRARLKVQPQAPSLVIIGNIAYDIIDFSRINKNRKKIIDIGGACTFSSILASFYHRIGIVGKVGEDFDISKFYEYNIDLTGVKRLNRPTTTFYTYWNSVDGQDREVMGEVEREMEVGSIDIPQNFLGAKHFHLATATPEKQLEIIKFLRENTNATISVDTIDEFASKPSCKEVFNKVDIAFIDKEYTELLDSKAPIKIIKYGKQGCLYYSWNKSFAVHSETLKDEEVVDKTGAGDCLNGVFLNLIVNGTDEEEALKTAVNVATESIKHKGMFEIKLSEKGQEEMEVLRNEQ